MYICTVCIYKNLSVALGGECGHGTIHYKSNIEPRLRPFVVVFSGFFRWVRERSISRKAPDPDSFSAILTTVLVEEARRENE